VEQPRQALANVNFKTIVPQTSGIKLQKEFNALFMSIDTTRLVEHQFFNRAGQLRVHELSISLIRDGQGNPRGFSGMVRDVTDRNASSIALRESEERLNIIMNSINAGIVIIDPESHTVVEANPAALKMIGGKKTTVIGASCHKFLCPDTDGKCPMAHGVAQMEDKDQVLWDLQGNSIHVLKTVRQIYYDGRIHLLESFIDISDLKKVQDQLKESIQTARTANRVKSEFLANMSHELRTPLNHVIGFSELLLDPDFGTLNNIQEEYIRDIHESSRYLLSLINDILDLSKIEAGKMELEATTVDIQKILENSLVMVREKSIKHGVKLLLNIDGIPETIVADERKLKQILYNLLSNSIKFTPDNGIITLSARLSDHFAVTPEKEGMLEISVSDTGIGIGPDDMSRVFNYFEQLENPAVKKYPGTGIGLALTKQMVELHNGKIWAESQGPGKGATFAFTLPVAGKGWS
jgi:PAS domain S-box-containing protein